MSNTENFELVQANRLVNC